MKILRKIYVQNSYTKKLDMKISKGEYEVLENFQLVSAFKKQLSDQAGKNNTFIWED